MKENYIYMCFGCALLALLAGFAISFAQDLLHYNFFAPHVLASLCPVFFVPVYAGRLLSDKAPLDLPARLLPPLVPLLLPLLTLLQIMEHPSMEIPPVTEVLPIFVPYGLFLLGLFLLLFLPPCAGLLLGASFFHLLADETLALFAGAAAFGGVTGALFGAALLGLFADDALAFFAGATAFGGITGALFGAAAFLAALLRSAAAFFSFLAGFLGLLPGLLGGLQHGRESHIGLVEQLEIVAGVGIAGVEIRVQLEGPLAVGAFELLQAGVLVQPEYLVALLEGELSAAFHESLTAVG